MGWGSRNGQRSTLPRAPAQDRTVHISEISKEQMARALNEQTERFQQNRAQMMHLTRLLIAIVQEPEALVRGAEGRCTIAADALDRVKNQMQLQISSDAAGDAVLTVVPMAPLVDIPRVAIPS